MVYCDLWWWFIVNYNDGLLYLWWCFIVNCHGFFELRGVRYMWQISKKGGVLVALPSVTLDKERSCRVSRQNTRRRGHFLLFWEPSLPSVFGFAECILMDTRQSDHKIWPLLACLPSVFVLTLGKLEELCRVFSCWHSAKLRNFAECFPPDTQQTWETLPSVFPSCTRQNRRHRAILLTFFCREFIFVECLLTLGKLFAECSIKNTRQTTDNFNRYLRLMKNTLCPRRVST